MTAKEKIDYYVGLLPDSWETFALGDFMKTVDLPISEGSTDQTEESFSGIDNTLKIISVILDVPVHFLEEYPLDITIRMAKRISFITDMPKVEDRKVSDWWKPIETVTYNDFVTFLTLAKDAVHNMPEILRSFARDPLTKEQINNMSVAEAYAAFFTLKKYAFKSLRRLENQTARKLLKQTFRNLPPIPWPPILKRRKKRS